METFELGTNVENVHEWSFLEGCREFIQGYLDNPNGGDWSYEDEMLILTNPDTTLERKVLLAGFSTKREDKTSRGKFGDGMASGICCLLREGYEIIIENGEITWTPNIGWSEVFQHEVIVIEETLTPYTNDDYKVYIKGLSESDMDEVVSNTLELQREVRNEHQTSLGAILLDDEHKGKVFVGGLFVSHFDSEYGFDFKPECFALDRDRKSLKPFDIQYQCKDMWGEVASNAEGDTAVTLIESMKSGDSSLAYVHHHAYDVSPEVKEKAENLYNEEYEGKLVASEWSDAEALREAGNEVVLVKNSGLANIIRNTDSYRTFQMSAKEVLSVEDLLQGWKDTWSDELSLGALDAFNAMFEKIIDKV